MTVFAVAPRGADASGRGAPMFGRARERAELLAMLRDPDVRLVTVTGRGGVGKTRLAMEATRVLQAHENVPVVTILLSGITDPGLVTSELSAAVGVAVVAKGDPMTALADRLQVEGGIVVLDNFEQVLAAAPEIGMLADRCDRVRFLVTSQARLRLHHERVLALSPLRVPDPEERAPEVLARDESVALYCDRAAAVDRAFALDEDNAPVVAQLCRRLEGLPLAIELAAARAATLPPAELLRHLDATGIGLLRRTERDTPHRLNDLRAAIEWSYDLLGCEDQRLLRRMSLISGTFDLETVASLNAERPFADVVDTLESLVDFHLVDRVVPSDPARFQIASSIRVFGREELEQHDELNTTMRIRIAHAARVARAATAGIASKDEAVWLDALDTGHDELVAALQGALGAGLAQEAIDIVVGLAALWDTRGYYDPQRELLNRALKLGATRDHSDAAYANALVWSAFLGFHRGQREEEAGYLDHLCRGEELARLSGDDSTLLRALSCWILLTPFTRDVARSTAASSEALRLAEETRSYRWLGRIEAWSGMIAHQIGEEARALELGRAALTNARIHGDQRTLVLATMLLLPLTGKYPEIQSELPPYEEVLRDARVMRLEKLEALLLAMLVVDAVATRDVTAALTLAAESLAVAGRMIGTPIIAINLATMVSLAALCGDVETAASFHGAVRDQIPMLARSIAPRHVEGYATTLDQVRQSLGASRFEQAVQRGSAMTEISAFHSARAYVHDAASRLEQRGDPADVARTKQTGPGTLTTRQTAVLTLLARGLSNKDIAARLNISAKTVMHHTTAIYQSLGVRGRADAAVAAVQMGLAE